MIRLALLIVVFALSPRYALAGANSFAEITGAEPSVRANGMADAYTAAQGDVYGMYYNPAQTAQSRAAGLYFQRGYSDDSTGALALSLPEFFGGFSAGVSLLYYNTGDLDLFSSAGTQKTVTGEKDYIATVSLSRKFGAYSVGANLKLAHISLFETASDSTGLLDLGVLADYSFARVGFALQNLGGKMQLGSEEERVPSNWRIGASRVFRAGSVDITGAFDMLKRENEPAYLRAGAEFLYNGVVALRAGYEFQNSLSEDNTLRFGCGFVLQNMNLDYALVPYQNLGSTHRFSLTYRFGDSSGRSVHAGAEPAVALPAVAADAPAPPSVAPEDTAPAAPQAPVEVPQPPQPLAPEVVSQPL